MVFGGNYGLGWGYTSTFVVILAETGMGKTAELRARAAVLRAAGEEAYIGPDRPVLLFVCVRDVPGLLARSSNENRVRHCAGTGGGDDDRHETWKCSRETVLRRNCEHGPTSFAGRREPSGDGSKPCPDGADRHRILTR